jgi:anti-anti-sigma factor
MDAKVENRDGIFVVSLVGKMDFESADSLKARCLQNLNEKNVIFNLRELSFVGSSGITPFLELLHELSQNLGPRFKICSVGNEFLRLFESEATGGIEIYRDLTDAQRAFSSGEVQALMRLRPFGLKLTID